MGTQSHGSKDKRLPSLCAELAPLVTSGSYAEALAIAVLCFVYSDASWYSRALREAKARKMKVEGFADSLMETFPVGASVDAAKLEAELRKSPLTVLHWLDRMLATRPEEGIGFGDSAYLGDVLRVEIDDATRARLELPTGLERAYLCRNIGKHWPKAPVERQGFAPNQYTPNWHVMADMPDPQQSGRKVEVYAPSATFQHACEALRKKQGITIYLAEFHTPPDFDSCFVDAAEGQVWTAIGMRNADAIIVEVKQHLKRALELQADVVIFPELTFPPKVRVAAADWLCAQPGNDDNDGHVIQWVVAGSFHCPFDSILANQNSVLDRLGNVVTMQGHHLAKNWGQEKLTSVELVVVREGNHPGEAIMVAHTALGMQAVVICLDLAQTAVLDKVPLEMLPLRWLWVPSMSDGVTGHQARARQLAVNRTITVVCANQAQARFSDALSLEGKMLQSFVMGAVDTPSSTGAPDQDGANWKLRSVQT